MPIRHFSKGNYKDMDELLTCIYREFEELWAALDTRRKPEATYVDSTGNTSIGMDEYPNVEIEKPHYYITFYDNRVYVVNGPTADIPNVYGDYMGAYVNGKYYDVAPFVSELQSEYIYMHLAFRFTAPTNAQDKGRVDIVDLSLHHDNTLPDNTNNEAWYYLGYVSNSNGYVRTVQHVKEPVNIAWYYTCGE